MGRITPSARQRIQETMVGLKKMYRAALRDAGMQRAFDEVWRVWSSEMAAIIYANPILLNDLLILTAEVDNRRVLEKLRRELEDLNDMAVAELHHSHTQKGFIHI